MTVRHYKLIKWSCYFLLSILCFALQSVAGLFSIAGVKPMLLAGLAVSVTIFEEEIPACIFAAFCGFLCDMYSYDIAGYYAFMFFVYCVFISAIVKLYMRPTFYTCILLTGLLMLLLLSVSFLFQIMVDDYASPGQFYRTHILTESLYTAVVSGAQFFIAEYINRRYIQKTAK